MAQRKMTFDQFIIALKGSEGWKAEWLYEYEYSEQLRDEWTLDLNLEEFPACCGIQVIYDLRGLNDLSILCAAETTRKEGYTVAMATDLASRPSRDVLLRNGWKITKTFTNERTGNQLNVYTLDLYPEPNYRPILERLQGKKTPKTKVRAA